VFGARTEKTALVVADGIRGKTREGRQGQRRPGHGRNGQEAYWGAQRVTVEHAQLKAGQMCPDCGRGKLYELRKNSPVIWLEARAPVQATVYECQQLRCGGCGKLFSAEAPPPARERKYDASVGAMVAMLRYGNGMPFHRLQHLQCAVGIPLPAAVQWQLVRQKAEVVLPVHRLLVQQAAQGQLMLVDDTPMKILAEMGKQSEEAAGEQEPGEEGRKKGIRTTAIVSSTAQGKIVLYRTGHSQAGDNMDWLLSRRATDLDAPIQMCDALPSNLPAQFQVILANCLCHARRKVVEVAVAFPREVALVLVTFEQLYANEELVRRQTLSAQERLEFHHLHSGFLMEGLRTWMQVQMSTKTVEPNSSLGQAFAYMIKHWEPLTLFLRVPAAPLDNNICEQILKRAILHRKNSLFYKTRRGAQVGDLLMGIITTCIHHKVDPFRYLTEVENHAAEIASDPEAWLPWNYAQRGPAPIPPPTRPP
jgi:transposase